MTGQTSGLWHDVVPRVDADRCQHCDECAAVAACPVRGLQRSSPDASPVADADLCLGCYACADACPHGAVLRPRDQAI